MLTPLIPKTKIVATIGPACDSEEMLEKMILAGVSVFRFNMKHGDQKWHSDRIMRLRKVSQRIKIPVATLMDLQGPEIRIGDFKEGKIELKRGERVYFAVGPLTQKKTIVINNLKVLEKIKPGQKILIADGFFEFKALKNENNQILAEVIEGGILGGKKNVTLPGLKIELPTLVERDLTNISLAAKEDIDFFALSFVRNKEDILTLRKIIKEKKLDAQIIAKIEQQEALENFEEILSASDGIMVARGDLGVQLPMEKVPYYQKLIIQRCRDVAKPVIVATQMLESMIENPRPTRAEVNDVANAIYDSTDAIMLSAESAAGKYPVKAVETMVRIASFIEEKINIEEEIIIRDQVAAIVYSAYNLINQYLIDDPSLKGICIFTETGKTARLMSRLRPNLPIYTFTQSEKVRDQLCLSWGVTPFFIKEKKGPFSKIRREALLLLKDKGFIKRGDKVVMIYGSHFGVPGQTNTIRVENI